MFYNLFHPATSRKSHSLRTLLIILQISSVDGSLEKSINSLLGTSVSSRVHSFLLDAADLEEGSSKSSNQFETLGRSDTSHSGGVAFGSSVFIT